MNITKELLIEKAQEGYTVCYADACPLRTQCLRWLVGQQMPHTYSSYRCVNPHFGVWRLPTVRCIAATRRYASPKV